MATPRRRSSRLRGSTPSRIEPMASATVVNKLSSLVERDESPPKDAQQSIDTLVTSPIGPSDTATPARRFNVTSSALKTPQTTARLHPGLGEMHPSKVHQSTSKPLDERMTSPVRRVYGSSTEVATPSKSKDSLPSHMSSPGFDFNFTRPESDLSAEAQKIMDSVREEAARIKAQMQAEKDKQEHKYEEANQLYGVGGRKIAKAKGKSGRFSDAHKEQFKKMDSIANHASTWKNKLQTNATSLKRSNSKAGLDEPCVETNLPKSTSTKSLRDTGRLENTAPGKRVKKNIDDDTSTARPMSSDSRPEKEQIPSTPARTAPSTNLPSAITTPTKASLARSVSVKSMKASMIPSLSRSASTKTLKSAPKSEGSNKYKSSLAKLSNMKSILSRHQPKFSDDPAKIAAGTHLPAPGADMNLDKELPALPGSFPSSEQRTPTVKRVDFTPNTISRHEANLTSSPSKIPTQTPRQPPAEPSNFSDSTIEYSSLVNSPNVTHRSPPKPRETHSTPGDFTFTSARTINFGPPSSGLLHGATIRQVRPSGFPTPVSVSFGNSDDLPAIPHGMSNKKRKHADTDDEDEDRENRAPLIDLNAKRDETEGPRAKRAKTSEAPVISPQKKMFKTGGSRIPKMGDKKGKGGLSLSRLNMLARPKERK